MVSKNNRIKRMEEAAERQSHFGIRKLTVGAASVLLGITLLFGANAKVARADETTGTVQSSAVQSSADTGAVQSSADTGTAQSRANTGTAQSRANTGTAQSRADTGTAQSRAAEGETQSSRPSGSTDQSVVRRAEEPALFTVRDSGTGTSEQQDKNPDWYMTDPSKATDENAARKNLEQAIAYAKDHPIKGLDIKGEQDAKGRITVAPDPKKKNEVEDAKDAITIAYDNEKDSAQYMQSIANKIWDETKTYEAYEAEREKFMDGLAAEGLYNPKTDVDPTTLSQHLTLDSEPDAIVNLEIKNNSGDWITATKNGLENGLEIDKLETKENDLLTIYNGADKPDLDAMGSKRGWTVTFKKNDPVKDPFIRLTFTNLKNSHYDDGTNAAVVPIDKIVETFSDVHATNGDPAKFVFANDPTKGWWYNRCSGVTATIQLYGEYDKTDKDGKVEKEEKLITLNQPVYMSVSSLNSGGEKSSYKESAELESDGEAYKIPESSVIADNKKLYSPYYNNWYLDGKKDPDYKDSDYYDYWGEKFEPADWHRAADEQTKVRDLGKHIVETYKEWDNPDQYNRIFGSGLYKVNGDQISVRSYVGGSQENQSISKYNNVWFAYSTIIPKTTFDAKHPGTTINYHFAKAINVNTSQTVEFVDEHGKQLITPNNIQNGFSFQIKDGKPTVESHTYNNVPVPVIPGYVADKTRIQDKDGTYVSGPKIIVDKDGGAYVPGQMVTVDNPNVTIEVVYTPVDTTQHAVVNYLDSDEGNKQITTSGDLTGPAGAKIVYNTKQTIDDLAREGYELVRDGFPEKSFFDHDESTTQTYEVILKHAHIPVTPDKPGNGLDHDALTKTVTEKVNYVVDGDEVQAPAAKDASLTFKGTAYYDAVTKKWTDASGKELTDQTKNITWTAQDGHQFGVVVSPEVKGYHVANVSGNYNDGNGNVKAITGITENSKDITVTVEYTKNPVVNDQKAQVIYRDISDPNKIVNIGDPDTMTGKPDETIVDNNVSTRIDELTKKGYVLSNNGFPTGAVFDGKDDTTQIFYVDFKHGTITVTPDKPGDPKKPINPDDPDSPTYPVDAKDLTKEVTRTINYYYNEVGGDKASDTVIQKVIFKGTGYVDKVTGQLVQGPDNLAAGVITWQAVTPTRFEEVDSPVIYGYTPDKYVVDAVEGITRESPDIVENVVYTPVPEPDIPVVPTTIKGSQTIRFVDEKGKELHPSDVQTAEFTNSYTFGMVKVPVIQGYVATEKVAGGKTVTEANPHVVVTVVYKKIGNIIPVDEDNKPIPGVPTPPYKNDPDDPTKVIPTQVPNIPGYTPNGSKVTPSDPTKDTKVIYRKTKGEKPNKPSNAKPGELTGPTKGQTLNKPGNSAITVHPLANAAGSNSSIARAKKSETLPQTGEKNVNKAGIIGLTIATLGALFGLAVEKKRKSKEN